ATTEYTEHTEKREEGRTRQGRIPPVLPLFSSLLHFLLLSFFRVFRVFRGCSPYSCHVLAADGGEPVTDPSSPAMKTGGIRRTLAQREGSRHGRTRPLLSDHRHRLP